MSVPEAFATTIRILLMLSIVLAYQWNPGVWARPTPRERLIGTPSAPHRHPVHPWAPRRPARVLGTVRRGVTPPKGVTPPTNSGAPPLCTHPWDPLGIRSPSRQPEAAINRGNEDWHVVHNRGCHIAFL